MLQDQRIWLLVSLKLSGEASLKELEELDLLIQENPEISNKVELLTKLWQTSKSSTSAHSPDAYDRHMQRLNDCLGESPISNQPTDKGTGLKKLITEKQIQKGFRIWWPAVAVSVLLVWFFYRGVESPKQENGNNTVSTKPGFKANVVLPDGSKVSLHGASKLTYNLDFEGKTREVYLSGEAFFDVAKDKNRPFIIHTRTMNLKVLGTSFNIRSYENEEETETALVHGSIEVMLRNAPEKKIVLKAGEKLVVRNSHSETAAQSRKTGYNYNEDERPIVILSNIRYDAQDSSSLETSWMKNQLVFDNENLEQIAAKIERWFNVKVIIKDEGLNQAKFTGTFENESLDKVIEALKLTGGFRYTIKDREVIIKH